MIDWLIAYRSLLDIILINAVLAFSQYIVLRAGVFSLATAGLSAIGAYGATNAVFAWGWPAPLGVLGAAALATGAAVLIALPLARLRGVYQAIATLAFVQLVLSVTQNATALTGGALGMNGIPRWATTPILLAAVGVALYVLICLGRSWIGRAFDTIREDETVAASLGIDVARMHVLAFALSGALAGLGGALEAYHSYSITPDAFGFRLLVACLTFVVLGRRVSPFGPLVGAAILTALPEIARPFRDYALLVHGALLIAAITWLPDGVVDTIARRLRTRTLGRPDKLIRHAAPVA
jgi:branched-chain amino acid transport system permease protein